MLKISLCCAVLAAMASETGNAHGQPVSARPGMTASATSPFALFTVTNNATVDGATLSLRLFEGGLARVIKTPGGTQKKANFILLNDRFGTVSEGEGNGNVVGLFVLNQSSISIVYTDGRSEILASDSAGRFSIMTKEANGDMVCESWHPAGHRFSAEEREAALARVCDPSRP